MKNDIKVAVYDFEWRKLSLCRSIEEAARVYELPAKYIKESICHCGRIVSGLRFQKEK